MANPPDLTPAQCRLCAPVQRIRYTTRLESTVVANAILQAARPRGLRLSQINRVVL